MPCILLRHIDKNGSSNINDVKVPLLRQKILISYLTSIFFSISPFRTRLAVTEPIFSDTALSVTCHERETTKTMERVGI